MSRTNVQDERTEASLISRARQESGAALTVNTLDLRRAQVFAANYHRKRDPSLRPRLTSHNRNKSITSRPRTRELSPRRRDETSGVSCQSPTRFIAKGFLVVPFLVKLPRPRFPLAQRRLGPTDVNSPTSIASGKYRFARALIEIVATRFQRAHRSSRASFAARRPGSVEDPLAKNASH